MRMYELVLVFKSSLSESNRKKLLETIKDLLGDLKIIKEEALGEKVLAYPIKKAKSGFYHFLSIEGKAGISTDFEKKLLAQENILRHLLVRKK